MQEHFIELGYTNADPEFQPQRSNKHGFCKLEKQGNFYFAKYSKDNASRQSSVTTDIWWCQTIQELRKTHSLSIRTPQIIDHGVDWYIAQWVEGHPSAQPTDPAAKLDAYIDDYAKCLVSLDAIKPEWLASSPPAADNSTPYNQLDRRWPEWTKQPIAEGLLAPEQLEQARLLIHDYQKYTTPHLQHGDFVPWHILIDANQDWWLIDGEHASTQKARYYDLAYMYSRIFTRLHSPQHATRLLKAFMQHSGKSRESLYPALLPVMTSRAIGMHFDALNDLHGDDYRADAQDLLARCLSRDYGQLFF
jgi:hypothetical protein